MNARSNGPSQRAWDTTRQSREQRLAAAARYARGKLVSHEDATKLLEAVVRAGDRVCLEGDNQKQADFLAARLAEVDPAVVKDLHIVQSGVVLAEHLDLFEAGIAKRLDFSYSGPQGAAIARALKAGKIELGAVHTYLELFSRYFVDLTPHVALTVARCADRDGNLYMGPNTEDSPVVIEATAFKQGIVIAQVNELVDKVPRVDVPGDRVDFVVAAPSNFYVEPLFTRDPAQITETQILGAMLAIKGIYAPYGVKRLNHGIGFNTAAIELILPTYAEQLGLKGRIATHFALNPHPTLIPAIESGWVEQVHSFGSEVGMDDYMRARPDIFFTGRDGSMASNRMYCQSAGLYATDLFIGSTLQIDLAGNSSTFTKDRIAGFGGAPNMGSDPRGRRHASDAWLKAGREAAGETTRLPRGRKLVVQIVETFGEKLSPTFVENLDSIELAKSLDLALPPVMIYGDDVSHIVTEEGIANLLLCRTPVEREQAIRGVAGYTDVGRARDARAVEELRARKVIQRPEDLGIDPLEANKSLLAARSIKELMHWSGNLYDPPAKFRNW
ncbi:malonate decarboxylase subunit alpha [Mesorhizobium sp. YC-39]|uniref:malonate decarboxylase subunit alpha n=1 Tax=unclassified Mesorhizobium TaxID=325217 RepID=UPI0021E7D3AC|nr:MULTISPECIES: malonate decarboxylase subunit alpha [unclassified Mesorhizobium]MCV3206527.1 malonate decarboxylase subunit alpha [Mesorhizobium sp. YC-2]MCV3227073.1 malonate decarboxylase subunit alpha [Mesorhizobium sp. YC-39]